MDSPKIAVHVIIPNEASNVNETHIDSNQNRLYFSLSQPVGSHNCGLSKSVSKLIPSRPSTSSIGMIANINATESNCNSDNIALASRNNKSTSGHNKSAVQENYNNDPNDMACETPMKRLKKSGWYYGSISPSFSAKLLENEEDGSFLIRDSSSECYIFSMTFKLDGEVHHTRIEHSKGHFSFGRSRKFFCTTIVDFIEQAIEYSQNGNLLFFLHRAPALQGPVRLRMRPLLRMKNLSSLKQLCRFAILPYVRKDKIHELCIPKCLKGYLIEPFIDR
jgi:suppressor of cytokine signaling 7